MVWSWPCMVSILESRLSFMISMDWKQSAIIVSIPLRRMSKRSIRDIILARTSSFDMLDVPWNDGPAPDVPAPKEEVKGGGLSSSMLAPSAASVPVSSVLTSGAPTTRSTGVLLSTARACSSLTFQVCLSLFYGTGMLMGTPGACSSLTFKCQHPGKMHGRASGHAWAGWLLALWHGRAI
ncbi:hypothetical protein JCGZ_24348 [Jatropha curcas]|uniref:Uncharacterized protein n=1 Tax=Jatropha curcas TaxID=180498 RepID=A0A067LEQ6_JATCU|nr:hypothetical protein JCGZ_24348 [Jatropha curcas]